MESFQACGLPSLLSLLVAFGAVAVSTVALSMALLRSARAVVLSWAALAVALLPVGVGAAGMLFGRSNVDRAIASGYVDPTQVVAIRAEGYRNAGSCVTVSLVFAALPLLLAAGALAAAYGLRARASEK